MFKFSVSTTDRYFLYIFTTMGKVKILMDFGCGRIVEIKKQCLSQHTISSEIGCNKTS